MRSSPVGAAGASEVEPSWSSRRRCCWPAGRAGGGQVLLACWTGLGGGGGILTAGGVGAGDRRSRQQQGVVQRSGLQEVSHTGVLRDGVQGFMGARCISGGVRGSWVHSA